MVVDPVCKMQVNENTKWQRNYFGKTVYFCSARCAVEFGRDPKKYMGNMNVR